MAISYVGGQTSGRAGATSTSTVNFAFTGGTNSTPSAGDLVVVTVVVGSQARNPSQTIATPSGYTNLTQLNPNTGTYDTSMVVAYKVMGSTPDTSVTMPSTGNNADAQQWTIQCFRGVDQATPMDATAVSASAGNVRAQPNPGSITPVTAGAWVVICGGGAAATGVAYTAPTNFTTNFLTGFTADTNDAQVGSGYWSGWTSGAVDPGVYGGGSTTVVDSWAAYTLALRPFVAVTHATTGALTGQGSTLAGAATRSRAYATSGALTGQGSEIVGSADRQDPPAFVTHDTTGALGGQGSSIVGAASNFTPHSTSGALTGQGSTVAGSAARTRVHPSSGVLSGPGSSVVGAASNFTPHSTSGALVGAGSVVDGSASRSSGAISHDTSGDLVGIGAVIDALASNGAQTLSNEIQPIHGGGSRAFDIPSRKQLASLARQQRIALGILPAPVKQKAKNIIRRIGKADLVELRQEFQAMPMAQQVQALPAFQSAFAFWLGIEASRQRAQQEIARIQQQEREIAEMLAEIERLSIIQREEDDVAFLMLQFIAAE